MTKRKRVYLAGPMRHHENFNFPAFDKVKEAFDPLEWKVVSPADMDRAIGFDGTSDEGLTAEFVRDAMKRDVTEILKCDALCLLPGWLGSTGARCELAVAKAIGLNIIAAELQPTGDYTITSFLPADEKWRLDQEEALASDLIKSRKPQANPFADAVVDRAKTEAEREARFYALKEHSRLSQEQAAAETRVTSATGGQKGQKQAQLGALDPNALMSVAEVAGFGTQKYARYNFLKGYDWSLSYDAMQRHLHLFWMGTDNDDESTLPHLAHAAWHCLALLAFAQRKIGVDDRPV